MNAKPRKGDIVLVEWLDSCSPTTPWHDRDALKRYGVATCWSVGMIGRNGKDALVIHADWCGDMIGGMSAIPAACVRNIKVLRKRRKVRT